MLGMDVVVIITWVGLGQEVLCGNGKIPPGSLGMRLLTCSNLLVVFGGGSMGSASLVVKRGVWVIFVVLLCRKIQLHQRNGGLLLPEVGLMGNRSNGSSFVIVETIFPVASTSR